MESQISVPKLDDRLVHLGLDLLLERDLSAFENFVNMRTQFARLRIDDRELLFNSEGKDVVSSRPWRAGMSLKTVTLSSAARARQFTRALRAKHSESFDALLFRSF